VRVWRVCREPFASLDGKGAELKGGRWNSPGQPVVYTSEHLSLAILEVLVHLEVDIEDLPDDYVSVEIEIPDKVKSEVFNDTIDIHNIKQTRDYGDMWLTSVRTVLLSAPSAVIPKERNLCISPNHPDFKIIRTIGVEPFQFDPRLFEFS
jgi:RES domain-containing protein